ncbi:hypothetical protein Dimus_031451 [Dionaea muscipula]
MVVAKFSYEANPWTSPHANTNAWLCTTTLSMHAACPSELEHNDANGSLPPLPIDHHQGGGRQQHRASTELVWPAGSVSPTSDERLPASDPWPVASSGVGEQRATGLGEQRPTSPANNGTVASSRGNRAALPYEQ